MMAPCNNILVYITILVLSSYVAHATDPSQLQDFCVGVDDPKDALFVNGRFCKNPMDVTADDFLFKGLDIAGDTNNRLGSHVTLVNATLFPGLNTLGVSLARVDFAPHGLNPPHIHPRGTQVQTVLEGTLYVGFVTSNLANNENKFFTKVLNKGDVFVFPQGLIHFEMNIGDTPAVSLVALSSQNPGVTTVANSVFGTKPPISVDVLSKAFQLDEKLVKDLQSKF
ncbi:putative germin-like protein 2-1 [Silene latifolia]|uniref:putative germin-like protein 2-1 n=1 Tax=Silene latifolia TaxID=37657 RepID=UPI003D773A90